MFGGEYRCTLVWLEDLKDRGYLEKICADRRKISIGSSVNEMVERGLKPCDSG